MKGLDAWGTLGGMHPAEQPRPGGRETRLLVVTIAVSVGVLLLLARFRFPDEPSLQPADPAPAPLERLAARAAYDELASTMADLERRITPRVVVLRVESEAGAGFTVAPRVTPDRAVAVTTPGQTVTAAEGSAADVISRDVNRDLTVLSLPRAEDAVVTPRTGGLRSGPGYVVAVEGSPSGATLRPLYVGRMGSSQDPRTGTPLVTLSALQYPLTRGAAVFSLDGAFIGLVAEPGPTASIVTAEFLRGAAEAADRAVPPTAYLGVGVQPLSGALARATGADRGVMVNHLDPAGPAAAVLQRGDVIQAIDGVPVANPDAFRRVEQTRVPGATAVVSVLRSGKPTDVTVVAAGPRTPSGEDPGPASPADHGIVGRTVRDAGIEIVSVRPGSAAALAGLRRGDLIVLLNGGERPDTSTLNRTFRGLQPGQAVLLGIERELRREMVALEKR